MLGGELAAACDVDVRRARELVALHGSGMALAEPNDLPWRYLDAVFVCTPPFVRGEVELAAIRAGVAIFLEKPVGVTAAGVGRVLEALKVSGVVNAVGYMNRYRNSVGEARRLARERGVLALSCNWVAGRYGVWWREQDELSGGGLNDEATHLVDLARYLVGEIVEVEAVRDLGNDGPSTVGTVAAVLRFELGQLGTLLYNGQASGKQIGLRLHTPTGELRLDSWDFDLIHDDKKVLGRPLGSDRSDIFRIEVKAFMDAVGGSGRSTIRSTFADAVKTQQVVDALRRSGTDGHSQTLRNDLAHSAGRSLLQR